MAERLRKRRLTPSRRHLDAAYRFLCEREELEASLEAALLAAAQDGWSMREIAGATGLSASTVCRYVNHAEAA